MNRYTFVAYDFKSGSIDDAGNFNIRTGVQVHVEAENEEKALKLAKKNLKRKEYLLTAVEVRDASLHDEMGMASLKIQKQLLDKLGE